MSSGAWQLAEASRSNHHKALCTLLCHQLGLAFHHWMLCFTTTSVVTWCLQPAVIQLFWFPPLFPMSLFFWLEVFGLLVFPVPLRFNWCMIVHKGIWVNVWWWLRAWLVFGLRVYQFHSIEECKPYFSEREAHVLSNYIEYFSIITQIFWKSVSMCLNERKLW